MAFAFWYSYNGTHPLHLGYFFPLVCGHILSSLSDTSHFLFENSLTLRLHSGDAWLQGALFHEGTIQHVLGDIMVSHRTYWNFCTLLCHFSCAKYNKCSVTIANFTYAECFFFKNYSISKSRLFYDNVRIMSISFFCILMCFLGWEGKRMNYG